MSQTNLFWAHNTRHLLSKFQKYNTPPKKKETKTHDEDASTFNI